MCRDQLGADGEPQTEAAPVQCRPRPSIKPIEDVRALVSGNTNPPGR